MGEWLEGERHSQGIDTSVGARDHDAREAGIELNTDRTRG